MESDLFYMSVALLSVWREDNSYDYFACTSVDAHLLDYKIAVLERDSPIFNSLFHIFTDEIDFEGSVIYLTIPPCEEFVKASIAKGVSKIYYLSDEQHVIKNEETIELIPFPYTFGRIMDVFSKYKPVVSTLNRV
jgi:hypothetical protein